MPGPSQISCPFFPTGFFGAGFFWPPWYAYGSYVHILTIIKVGYGVTPRPYPILSCICWLLLFLVFLLIFVSAEAREPLINHRNLQYTLVEFYRLGESNPEKGCW